MVKSQRVEGLRWRLCWIAMPLSLVAAITGTLTGTSRAAAQVTELQRIPAGSASLTLNPTSRLAQDASFTYAVGDRLKITFFEQLQSELTGGQSAATRVLSTLVERSELTGDYLVQQDGNIFLPLLGPVRVAGQTPQQLEQAMVAEFDHHWNGQVKISIQLTEREPIYVTGPVAKPGTFKHVPGMTILHALTLAGGVEGAATEHWRLLDVTRERERMRKSAERLKKLLVRTEVLISEREGKAPVPSNQLMDLAGRSGAQELVAAEERLRFLERGKRKGQEAAFNTALVAMRNELTIQREKMLQIEAGMKEKAERVEMVVALRTRGATTDVSFHAARSELNEARERWHEVRAGIAQTERKIAEVQQEKVRLGLDTEFEREREIRDMRNSITEEEVTRATIGNLLSTNPTYSTIQSPGKELSYTIVRRTPSGPQRLSASEVSALEPGDILQVVPLRPELASH
jgi:exopolysaccharide production protein ExoF